MKVFRYILILFLFVFIFESAFATHNRAGQITYRHLSGLTYEVTITTFTRTSSAAADRPTLDSVYFGDTSTPEVFVRSSKINLPNDISKNIYVKNHTYAGSGTFVIRFTDPNRNEGVVNVPHSVSQPFYLEDTLIINSFLGNNSSPITTKDPIDQGCVNRIFKHNPGAYDPDPNDSLSYELVECGGDGGISIPGYYYPPASNSFTLNPVTGDLIWDSPQAHTPINQSCNCNEYNVAFNIIQWRKDTVTGLRYNVGTVRRDMQIQILNCDDYPPVISVINDTCVLANEVLTFQATATDPDFNPMIFTASGAPFDAVLMGGDPASYVVNSSNDVLTFSWPVKCHHIRPQPYYVQFQAESGTSPTLVDLKGTFIHVIAPPPPSVTAIPNGSGIDLHWTPAPCGDIFYYNIYRRNGQYPDTIQCPCENGVPSYTGYTLIGTTANGLDTIFYDDNNGQGLTIGIEYCYLVTAVYAAGSESCASQQTCASLKKDAPVITNADVRFTDPVNGSVFVGWSKPTELDTLAFTPPYEYRIFHSTGFYGAAFTQIGTLNTLNDTAFIDTLIDTQSQPWSYKIELWYTDINSALQYKGKTAVASTIFLSIAPTDNKLNLTWEEHVPWSNSRYDIFKQNPSLTFDSIGNINVQSYSDTGLVNGVQQCYYIRSIGSYTFSGFVDPIVNRSQIDCEIPFDNVHPCSPQLAVASDCDNSLNLLTWTNPNNYCADDVLKYYIYYAPSEQSGFERIDSILIPTDTTYVHSGLTRISGCYKIAAVDSVGNETLDPMIVCVDTCRQYVLPSVFTPDGDFKNDLFHPCDSTTSAELQAKCPPYKNVESVDMKIFNRWGNIVFETADKNINWDGKNKDTHKDCPDGVYYYTCKVFFFSVKEVQSVELHGTIQLIRAK